MEEFTNSRTIKYLYLVLTIPMLYYLTACTLSYNITDLDQKYNSSTSNSSDKTAPVLSGTVIDGVSYGSLSTTPNLLWPTISEAKNGLDHYELAVGSTTGGEEVLSWTNIGNNTNHAHSGLMLTKGRTYFPKIRAVDTLGNVSPAIWGDGWIATTLLSFLQPTYTLITGESITLSLTGGETPYTFQSATSGYLNTSTGVYTAALNITPRSETVSATDFVAQQSQVTVNIRAFEDKNIFRSSIYQPDKPNSPVFITSNSLNVLFSCGGSQDVSGISHSIIKKSMDGGTTWVLLNDFQYAPGKYSVCEQILPVNATEVYAVLSSANDSSNLNHWVIRKSVDGGDSWNTVDDYIYSAANTYATSISVNHSGHLFVAGYGSNNWIVRRSTDSGATWNNVDNFNYAGYSTVAKSIKIDNSGILYVSGLGADSSSIASWLVRKSTDNGNSWTTVDTFQLSPGYDASCETLEISGSSIFAAGIGLDSSSIAYWVTRRSSDGGASWSTIDTYNLAPSFSAYISQIYSPSPSTIYTVGSAIDSNNISHWIVRKSTDNGNSWSTVDNFLASSLSNIQANAKSITSDSSGNIYTLGTGEVFFTDVNHWFVRKSSNSGASWVTIEDYSYTKKGENRVMSLAYDSSNKILYSAGYEGPINYSSWVVRKSSDNGITWTIMDSYQMYKYSKAIAYKIFLKGSDLYALGNAADNTGIGHWIVRRSSDGGNSWSNIDDWTPYANSANAAKAIAFDSSGNIYVGGYAVDGSFYQRWIVRKSSNNGASWTTVDNYAPNFINLLNDMIVTSANEIIVTGSYLNPSSQTTWLTRKSSNAGSSWTNIDTFQMTSTKTSVGNKIFISSANEIYISGSGVDASNIYHSLIRKSSDNGSTWSTIYNNQLTTTKDTSGVDFTIDSNNYFYALSMAKDTSNLNHIIVQKSSNAGVSWMTIDDYTSIDTNKVHSARAILPCFTNQLCIGGSRSVDSDPINQGIVRILSPVP